ncbi:PREDICTED: RAD51-associated protein 2 [Haliaeetus leucocephalus]|uniref:RAD51-associated protein 2 n=1 Tax=Haliaeetus leucocephalus TaxID=52644 RepID=UPI00053CD759|nr:PREDICTED: RAD51-associated protein 2 [Haliaeetus leucocephalus]
MESTCSERFLSASSDETERYLYPKRIKIESNQKSIEKEEWEQQKLEQSVHRVNRYQTSPHEPIHLSERQNNWALETQSCDAARKTSREFFHFQSCSNEKLPCRVSENKLSTKKWNPENESQNTKEDDISLNAHGQLLEAELLNVWSAANICKNLQVLNPPQVQQNNNIEQNDKRSVDNELRQNSSVTPLKRDSFQMEYLSHKSISDKKWKQYQLLQIPFLRGTSSVFSHIEHEKDNFMKKVCSTEDNFSSNNETTAERDNKEKNNSSSIIPTLKPFKSIQQLKIPNFQLPSISNKINSKMTSTNLEEMDWKNFKGQTSLMQSKQLHGVQKMSEVEKQKLQNDKSSVKASTVGTEFKEKNYPSISKEEHSALAEGGKVSVTYFRDNSTDIECNQIFAENCFKDKVLENSDGDDDQKSTIHIYISAKNIQNEKCVSCNDLLKRMGRKSSNEKAGTFHIQTSIPVITETLEKNNCIDADRRECVRSKELQTNSHNFLSKKYFSIFDTYEKIPLTTDSEDFDQIPVVIQDNSVKKKLSEENAVTSSKEVPNLPAKSNDALILPEQSKTTMEKCSSSFVNKDKVVSEDGHCRSSSSADKQKQSEKIHATIQYPSTGSPAMPDTYLQLQAKETVQFSLQGHTQTNKAANLEPATLKHNLEYVKEQEEIYDEQMHVTNESQCETVMNDLIMSYSEDESKTFIAAEEELKMHLTVMNNGCLEDVKDKYLPLENKITYEFELKRRFDLVLEELHMFHEISKGNENNLSSLETNSHNNYCELNNSEGLDENVTSVPQKKLCISSPISGTIEGQNITDSSGSSLNKKISNENEDQKVSKEYCISRLSSEELLHLAIAEGHFDAAYKKPYTWDPAFLSCTLLKEQNYNLQKEGGYFLSHEVIRVQPLKTCKGPIRIGLSRKARPKQLHPYLK